MLTRISDTLRVLIHGLPAPTVKTVVREVTKEVPYNVVRHQLGSISIDDIRAIKNMDESELKTRNGEAALIYTKPFFKRELDLLKDTQAYWMAEQSEISKDGMQQAFGRGTINGITIVYEHFERLAGQHLSETAPKEKVDTYGISEETPISTILGMEM